jgi:hypothetical protein
MERVAQDISSPEVKIRIKAFQFVCGECRCVPAGFHLIRVIRANFHRLTRIATPYFRCLPGRNYELPYLPPNWNLKQIGCHCKGITTWRGARRSNLCMHEL